MTEIAKRGRQKSFDRAEALEKAAHLFWKRGFSPTSLAELTSAMGIHPPSLYNAFGGKEDLFLEVLDNYMRESDEWLEEEFAAYSSMRQAFAHILLHMADFLTDPVHPPGCLLACGGVNLESADSRIEKTMSQLRHGREEYFLGKLRKARRDGELPAELSPRSFAAYFQSVQQGMSALARDGANRERLREVARVAMLAWPASDQER